ncbi:hypothetical protein PR1_33 [Providencia phage vB_PreS_PR1]|uniref:Uncharacterized protein n=1 Tax=Providencia phage vB_PreS_PR1 TaxID=1931407 RepID=A0A1S6KV94_9CAUD|nr:hypothetical protein FDH30_gp034 [Providencia phage vB_PreS_PR1]AQT25336.1 hypothetical protein PR1_33 [Providencia phage vB_PreS_PR1]
MTGLTITLLVLQTLLIAVLGVYPAYEVARTVREVLIKYVYPIRSRKTIATVLVISALAWIAVAVGFTIPMSQFVYLLITGV